MGALHYQEVKKYIKHDANDLNEDELREMFKASKAMERYLKKTKELTSESIYHQIMKKRKKKVVSKINQRIHGLRGEYAREGKPLPPWLIELIKAQEKHAESEL